MSRNRLIIVSLLSLVGLFLAASTTQAQRGRGGRTGVQPSRVTYRPPVYRPAYSYPRYPYYGPTYTYPSFWYARNYAYPTYSYYFVPPTTYYTPPTYIQPAVPTTAVADIRVILPDPQATVLFDGQATSSTGAERLFHTPPLALRTTYRYRIRASWMQAGRLVTQERVVAVTPGQMTVVDFRHSAGEDISPPSPRE